MNSSYVEFIPLWVVADYSFLFEIDSRTGEVDLSQIELGNISLEITQANKQMFALGLYNYQENFDGEV